MKTTQDMGSKPHVNKRSNEGSADREAARRAEKAAREFAEAAEVQPTALDTVPNGESPSKKDGKGDEKGATA